MVVEGVLEKMSGRKVISSDGTATYTVRKLGGLYKTKKESVLTRHAGWTNYEFIDIGGQSIKNVDRTPWSTSRRCKTAIGEDAAPDRTSTHTNLGQRTGATHRHPAYPRLPSAGSAGRPRSRYCSHRSCGRSSPGSPGVVLFFITLLLTAVATAIGDYLMWVGLLAAVGVLFYFLVKPIVNARKSFKAAAALDAPHASVHPADPSEHPLTQAVASVPRDSAQVQPARAPSSRSSNPKRGGRAAS